MRSIWNGTLSFGLVTIPVKIYPAIKSNELSLHYLHEEDMGRIKNERVCQKCGETVDYKELVKGYEYQKGKYIALTEKDFQKVDVESSKNITILDFVDPDEIDPMFYDKPYYLAPGENGAKLYALLRESLKQSNKVGIAKLVFHDREHIGAIKANGKVVMLDTLHFADEIREEQKLELPAANLQVSERELNMAARLIENMSNRFDPEKYKDTYHENLLDLIDKKLEGKEIKVKQKKRPVTNVSDIMSKLKASIEETEGKKRKRTAA
jgi:DNA end-binding protein Ku